MTAAPICNDYHCSLLWLRAMQIATGHSPVLMLSDVEMNDLFIRYRSPWRA